VSSVSAAAKRASSQELASRALGDSALERQFAVTRRAVKQNLWTMVRLTPGDTLSLPYVLTSGAPPSSTREVVTALRARPLASASILAIIGLAATGLVLGIRRLPRGQAQRAPPGLLLFVLAVPVVHFALAVTLIAMSAQVWYWLPLLVGTVFGLALAASAQRLLARVVEFGFASVAIVGLVYTCALVLATGGLRSDYRGQSWLNGMYETAGFLAEHPDADQMLVGSFNSGLLGYVAPTRVVNLDGLANDWAFLEVARQRRIFEYLRANEFTHIAEIGHIELVMGRIGMPLSADTKVVFRSSVGGSFVFSLPGP
jgi:hypothetical protein